MHYAYPTYKSYFLPNMIFAPLPGKTEKYIYPSNTTSSSPTQLRQMCQSSTRVQNICKLKHSDYYYM